MNRMSHWRQPRAAQQQQLKRVREQQALSRQAHTVDFRRLSEKRVKPSAPESEQ